ncbi:MAG: c-type cytochrome [Cocleimonas sp.]|nr:c-type cytochrome [Cocleimonas sp.]
MKKMLPKALLLTGLALSISTSAFAADDKKKAPEVMSGASAKMLADTCTGCHGFDGNSKGPATPSIAGFSAEYLTEVMKAYKSGDASSTIMGRIMKGYSDEELAQVAEVYAKKKPVSAPDQKFDKALVKKGKKLHDKYCEKCHAEGGTSAEDDSGLLAGQWTPYLQATMADFAAGTRDMPKKMKKKVKKLTKKEGADGMKALFSYYASQQ